MGHCSNPGPAANEADVNADANASSDHNEGINDANENLNANEGNNDGAGNGNEDDGLNVENDDDDRDDYDSDDYYAGHYDSAEDDYDSEDDYPSEYESLPPTYNPAYDYAHRPASATTISSLPIYCIITSSPNSRRLFLTTISSAAAVMFGSSQPEGKKQQDWLPFPQKEKGPCGICLEDYERGDDVAWLTCGHLFHAECVRTWLGTSGTCPLCRRRVGGDGL